MKTNKELELEAIDKRIEAVEANIRFAEAIKRLEKNADYQLVIEQGFLEDEAKAVMSYLAGDEHISDEMQEGMNKALQTIRSYKFYIKTGKEIDVNADEILASEKVYRAKIVSGEVKLEEVE